jgi:predicted RNase H-like nuclease (RuvC/YqgF family)
MADNKGAFSWIVTGILLVVALAVGWSIWNSLKDARAKLAAQKEKMEELERKDASMRRYVDSLDAVIADSRAREEQLAAEREELRKRLGQLQREYNKTLARLDKLWEAGEVIHELDAAYPNWAGQFHEATRADGVQALLAPRFFGAEVAEDKAELNKRRREVALKDSTIINFEKNMSEKDIQIQALTFKADSILSTYENLKVEYDELDKKYRKEVASHWFKFTPGNALSAAVGFGAGYLVGK